MGAKPHPRAGVLELIAKESGKTEDFYKDFTFQNLCNDSWHRPDSLRELLLKVINPQVNIKLTPRKQHEVHGHISVMAVDEARRKKHKCTAGPLTHCERAILDLLGEL